MILVALLMISIQHPPVDVERGRHVVENLCVPYVRGELNSEHLVAAAAQIALTPGRDIGPTTFWFERRTEGHWERLLAETSSDQSVCTGHFEVDGDDLNAALGLSGNWLAAERSSDHSGPHWVRHSLDGRLKLVITAGQATASISVMNF